MYNGHYTWLVQQSSSQINRIRCALRCVRFRTVDMSSVRCIRTLPAHSHHVIDYAR